jgi:hypothetical protein
MLQSTDDGSSRIIFLCGHRTRGTVRRGMKGVLNTVRHGIESAQQYVEFYVEIAGDITRCIVSVVYEYWI